MGRLRSLAVLSAILFISQLAAAEVHHENYDDARTDLLTLIFYLQSSFEVLNDTLESVHTYDLEGSMEGEKEFSSMVGKARTTLSRIPEGVDSYPPLNLSVESLGSIDIHLILLVDGFETNLDSVEVLEECSFDNWTVPSVSENLTRADSALISFEEGLDSMERGRTELISDVENFRSFDWQLIDPDIDDVDLKLDDKILLLEGIEENIESLSDNRSGIEDILKRLMKRPMKDWDEALSRLVNEVAPGNGLFTDADLISASSEDLSEEMAFVVGDRVSSISNAGVSIDGFRSNQKFFLENISILEDGISTSAGERIQRFDNCLISMNGMDNEIASSRNILESDLQQYDNGTIEQDLLDLDALLESYRERLDRIDIWEPDLGGVVDGLNRTMWENVIPADTDGDGNLSDPEVLSLDLGSGASSALEEVEMLYREILDELSLVPFGYFPEVSDTLPVLETGIQRAEGFTFFHEKLIVSMQRISSSTRGDLELQMEMLDALAYLSRMRNYLSGMVEVVSVLSSRDIILGTGWEEPLNSLVSLYEGYLLSRADLFDKPTLHLTLDRDTAPFDTIVRYSIIAVDLNPVTGPFLPDGEVELKFDGSSIGPIMLNGGYTTGSILVERSYSTGVHILNASRVSLSGETVFSESTLFIRKLRTVLGVEPSGRTVSSEESAEFRFVLRDELFRDMTEEILLENGTWTVRTPGNITITSLPLGSNVLTAFYPGDDFFQSSERNISITVLRKPLLLLGSNKILYGRNETINITLELLRGNGTVTLFLNDIEKEWGSFSEGSSALYSIDSEDLGNGSFLVKAWLDPADPYTMKGWSNVIHIRVDLSIGTDEGPEDPVDDDDPDDDDPADDDDPDDDEGRDDLWDPPGPIGPVDRDLLQWVIFILSMVIIVGGSLFLMRKNRTGLFKERKISPEFRMPTIYTGFHGHEETATASTTEPARTVRPRISRAVREIEKDRERMIRYYLEMIETSPGQLGISGSMTPREVSSRLMENGLDRDLSDRIVGDFEWSIYKLGRPEKETLSSFDRDRTTVKGWFSDLLKRVGITKEPASGEVPT